MRIWTYFAAAILAVLILASTAHADECRDINVYPPDRPPIGVRICP